MKKPGQSFSDWLNSKDQDYLIRLQLKEGGDADDHSNQVILANTNKQT